jgi:N-acetylmuramoyl-L-alanine amidase
MPQILVAAGHSTVPPIDPGAVGSGYIEAQEALKLRDAVVKILLARGLSVVTDGSDGVNDPLKKAIQLAKQSMFAVEFHFNAGPPSATGIEVLAPAVKAAKARVLAQSIADATGLALRGGDGGYKSESSGQHKRLGFCKAGGLIVEICFISNSNDMNAYNSNFIALSNGLANAIALSA